MEKKKEYVKKFDKVGRIYLPKEIRSSIGLEDRARLEMFVDGENIVLKAYQSVCIFCEGNEELTTFNTHTICKTCIGQMAALME